MEASTTAGIIRRMPGWLLPALITAVVVAAFAPGMALTPWHHAVATYLHALLLEAFPWLVLGAIAAATAEVLLPSTALPRLAKRLGRWGIPVVAAAAPLVPMCECGIIAVVRGLLGKGLPLHLAVTFLLAAPILNPIVLATTWIAFNDWRMAALRGACGFIIATSTAWMVSRQDPARLLLPGLVPAAPAEPLGRISLSGARTAGPPMLTTAAAGWAVAAVAPPLGGRLERIAGSALSHLTAIAGVFIAGVAVAAIAKASLPAAWFAAVGAQPLIGPLAMMGAAVGLSLCAEADAFVAASLPAAAPHAILAFLVLGPMLDLKLLLMYRAVFTRRMIAFLAIVLIVQTWLVCQLARVVL